MPERRIEAFLDKHARKMIMNELCEFYASIQGDVPKRFLDALNTLEADTRPSRGHDMKIRPQN
jgi:hypothetical protein